MSSVLTAPGTMHQDVPNTLCAMLSVAAMRTPATDNQCSEAEPLFYRQRMECRSMVGGHAVGALVDIRRQTVSLMGLTTMLLQHIMDI